MRRLLLGPLMVALLTACLMVPEARAADVPYAGNWRLVLMDAQNELGLWLLKIDKEGKVAVVSGFSDPKDARVPDFSKSKISEVKASEKSLKFVFNCPFGVFSATAYPGKAKDRMNGSFRMNLSQFVRMRLEKTDDTEIDPKKAVKNTAGIADFQEAGKLKDKEEQLRALQDVLKDHEDKPITYQASQFVILLLMQSKADADKIKPFTETYLKQATPYGHEITIGANLALAQMLLGYDKTQGMALDFAKTASKLLTEDDPKGLQLRVYLTEIRALETNKKDGDVKAVVEKLSKSSKALVASAKDDDNKFGLSQLVAQELYRSTNKDVVGLGLTYAEDAAKLLKEDDATNKKLGTYQLQLFGQQKLEKPEAKKTAEKVEGLEGVLDKEYEKFNLSTEKGKAFVTKFTGRQGKSERVSVVELFTGAECPPCVAADIAFDGCLKTYRTKDVVFIQYHMHIPGPDALTNKDCEARGEFYGIEGTPALYLDGKTVDDMGGGRPIGKARYETLREEIEKQLETASEGKIELKVDRKGDKIDISANVSGLKEAGESVRLRFVLVEDTVRYTGGNRQRLHHNVVRAMPGGAKGVALEKKDASQKASVDLAEVRKELQKYLADKTLEFAKQNRQFSNPTRPLALKNLKVIALVQDDKSKKILQATQVQVPEPSGEKKEEPKKEEPKKDKD